ncbi:hypothetical protein [Motilimonas sp. E26]|uniref:alpha/beta hydrolase family protein n=1 Tax=Motilimonas sp. E26 TaxID=2865674 RepID=UPI001E34D741|nr:hypothetical protein [Motilimonas sp. E26]MCE0555946.1 hypothetical protein [Motilimonas sp. E26]
MKKVILLIALAVLSSGVRASEEKQAALTIKSIASDDRNMPVEVYYWYPTDAKATNYVFGNGKVFEAVDTNLNAPISLGKYPVVLLSHGGTRSSFYHTGWIASALAEKGYIVIAPKPPSAAEITPDLAVDEIAHRVSDLTLGLSHLDSIDMLRNSADKEKVTGVGFFLGGTSMLLLSGAKLSPSKYRASCDGDNTNVDCGWLAKNKVDITQTSDHKVNQSKSINGMKSVVVINPELTSVFDENTLKMITPAVTVIDLTARHHQALKPARLISAIPRLKLIKINTATEFSAFAVCTDQGTKILAAEGEEVICQEIGHQSRPQNHQRIVTQVLAALTDSLE